MTNRSGLALVDRDDDGVDRAFRSDVLRGLAQSQKALPARWLYDDAGSQLFEDITGLPEYYPTRAETQVLSDKADEFAAEVGPGRAVVEFGSGSSVKTPLLLSAIKPAAYVPIDISGDFLRSSAADLAEKFAGLPVFPVEADFMKEVRLPDQVGSMPKLGFFPGSTIGNMTPRNAVDLLRSMNATLGNGAKLLIGMDLVKDAVVLEAAYDDAQGVTAAFNLNMLRRINRELGGNIPVEAFQHEARWVDDYARVEMHLVATRPTRFEVSGQEFVIEAGESIHTENSHKFDHRSSAQLLLAGGWTPQRRWLDDAGNFSVLLAEARTPQFAP